MKTNLLKTLLLSMLVVFFGCSKDSTPSSTPVPSPTVDFTYSGANSPAPSTVTFNSSTTNATSYLWDFGDNGSSTLGNPQHLYSSSGVYTVKLTVTGAGGTNFTSKTVNIGAALTHVKITKVTFVNIPFTKSSGTSGWDTDGSGPDVYFQIQDTNSTVLFDATSSSKINDITPLMLPFYWTLTSPFLINDLTQPRFIELWDYDPFNSDEDIGYVGFTMSNYTVGTSPYPSTVTNTRNGITVKLDLIWY